MRKHCENTGSPCSQVGFFVFLGLQLETNWQLKTQRFWSSIFLGKKQRGDIFISIFRRPARLPPLPLEAGTKEFYLKAAQ